jgi:hypothetical protein
VPRASPRSTEHTDKTRTGKKAPGWRVGSRSRSWLIPSPGRDSLVGAFSPSTEVRQPFFRYRMSPCHLERHEPPEVPDHHPAPVKEFWIASRRSPRVEHHCRGTFIINGLPGCPGRSPRPGLPRILARGGAASGGWPTVPYGVLVTSTPMLLGSEDLGGRVLGRAAKEAQ